MVEKSSEIAGEIQWHRDRLRRDLTDLESQMRKITYWRTYYEKNPWLFVGTAVGGGLLLSELLSSRSNGGPRDSPGNAGNYTGGAPGLASRVLDAVKIALVSFGTAKAKEFLSEVLPGFEQHLRQTEPSGPTAFR